MKQDQNQTKVGGGVNSVDGVTLMNLPIDPVTGELLVIVEIVSDVVPTLSESKRDSNGTPVSCGLNQSDGITPVPLLIDNRNGNLWVDIA